VSDSNSERSVSGNSALLSVTALHCASSHGQAACVDALLASSANVNSVDCSGCTPLFYAITLGHAHCVTSLLCHGADPNHVDLKGRTYISQVSFTRFQIHVFTCKRHFTSVIHSVACYYVVRCARCTFMISSPCPNCSEVDNKCVPTNYVRLRFLILRLLYAAGNKVRRKLASTGGGIRIDGLLSSFFQYWLKIKNNIKRTV